MKLTKNKLFSGILFLGLIANLLVLFDIQYLYLREILSIVSLTIIPGLLIMLIFKIKKTVFWEYLVYTIGLSITLLMFGGLAINWILPWLHITDKPLSLIPLLTSFDVILSTLGVVAYRRNKKISLKICPPKLNLLNKALFAFPVIFPILSVLGATTLNNGGPNYLTKIMLGGIAIYLFLVVFLRKKLNVNIYPSLIIITSLSLLLTYSLRSWYVSGWDVSRESYVFRLTMDKQIWSINSYIDSYNSCLSISVLPTLISTLTSIKTELVFKLLFQVFFVFHSLSIFLLFRRYVKPVVSFSASYLYFGGVYYNSTFPTLIRQEIAFLFFGLMFLVLFNKTISRSLKNVLFLIFGFSMVVSHYSTSYIAFAIFFFIYICSFAYQHYENKKLDKGNLVLTKKEHFYLNRNILLALLVFQFIWISQFSQVSNDLIGTIRVTYENIGNIFNESLRDSSVTNALFRNFAVEGYTNDELYEYINEKKILFAPLNPYSVLRTSGYTPEIINSDVVYPRSETLTNVIFYYYQLIKYCIILSFIFGSIIIYRNRKDLVNLEFLYAIIGSIFLIFTIVFLPYISKVYNFERLFQQSLMFLSLSSVVFFQKLMKRFRGLSLSVTTLVYLSFSLFGMGFLLEFSGGNPTLNLYNTGFAYDMFYSSKEEVTSIEWLSRNYQSGIVYMDVHSQLKFHAFGDPKINISNRVIPIFMNKTSYVYSSRSNKIKGLNYLDVRDKYNKGAISFNFPTEFLNKNKNVIYNNGASEVFK